MTIALLIPSALTATSLEVIPPLAIKKCGLREEGGGRERIREACEGHVSLSMPKASTATSLEVIPPLTIRK